MITVESISRNYGDFQAVKGVSFTISPGEIVGMLGHNGAGKSTTLKMLTGFLEPTAGSISVDGHCIRKERLQAQSKIGYLPETCPLYPEMTTIEYLSYVADLRQLSTEKKEQALREVIERTGLKDKAFEPIDTLSKGYRQRVGIAQAILHKPDFLVLDEPTSGLDPSQIQEIRNLIKELSKSSTIILSTHIMQEVESLCDRVIMIRSGEIALDSTLEDLTRSNVVTIKCAPEDKTGELKKELEALESVKEISVETHDAYCQLLITVAGEPYEHTSEFAKLIVNRDCKLIEMSVATNDLESIFRSINSESGSKSQGGENE